MAFMTDKEYLTMQKEAGKYTKQIEKLIHGTSQLDEEMKAAKTHIASCEERIPGLLVAGFLGDDTDEQVDALLEDIEQAKKTIWRNEIILNGLDRPLARARNQRGLLFVRMAPMDAYMDILDKAKEESFCKSPGVFRDTAESVGRLEEAKELLASFGQQERGHTYGT